MNIKQVWKIGDCLKVMREYPDNYFDLILTDPPYGEKIGLMNFTQSGAIKVGGAYRNDYTHIDFSWDDECLTPEQLFEMHRISKNMVICGGNFIANILPASRCWIVWDKRTKDKYSNDFADCELIWTSFDKPSRVFRHLWSGMLQDNMKKKEERVHPTQKPVPLFEWILKNYAKTGDKILDPFCGSGTILESCLNLNLECLAIDKSDEWVPHYRKRLRSDNSKLTDTWNTKYWGGDKGCVSILEP